jgi:hypothetical protein
MNGQRSLRSWINRLSGSQEITLKICVPTWWEVVLRILPAWVAPLYFRNGPLKSDGYRGRAWKIKGEGSRTLIDRNCPPLSCSHQEFKPQPTLQLPSVWCRCAGWLQKTSSWSVITPSSTSTTTNTLLVVPSLYFNGAREARSLFPTHKCTCIIIRHFCPLTSSTYVKGLFDPCPLTLDHWLKRDDQGRVAVVSPSTARKKDDFEVTTLAFTISMPFTSN